MRQVPLRFSIYRWGNWSKGHTAYNRQNWDLNPGGLALEPFLLIPIMYWLSVTDGKCGLQHRHVNTPKERGHCKAKCRMQSADWWWEIFHFRTLGVGAYISCCLHAPSPLGMHNHTLLFPWRKVENLYRSWTKLVNHSTLLILGLALWMFSRCRRAFVHT